MSCLGWSLRLDVCPEGSRRTARWEGEAQVGGVGLGCEHLPVNTRKQINTMLPGGCYGPGSVLNAFYVLFHLLSKPGHRLYSQLYE